jgi:hypothetical protein
MSISTNVGDNQHNELCVILLLVRVLLADAWGSSLVHNLVSLRFMSPIHTVYRIIVQELLHIHYPTLTTTNRSPCISRLR